MHLLETLIKIPVYRLNIITKCVVSSEIAIKLLPNHLGDKVIGFLEVSLRVVRYVKGAYVSG